MKQTKIGFIGAGNMGMSIIKGLCKSSDLGISVFDIKKSPNLPESAKYVSNLSDLFNSDYIVLAVKPNIFEKVLQDIKKCDNYKDKNYISIAAGITTDYIKSFLGDVKVTRAMPNLPLQVGEGMTVISLYDNASDQDKKVIDSIFSGCGKACYLKEEYIDMSIAVNGSGPAYVFMFIEALADGAVKNGIDRQTAYLLASQTVFGAAKMVLESNVHPAVLKDMVCSPAGTTIEAVAELEKLGFRKAIMGAVEMCTQKAINMSKNKK